MDQKEEENSKIVDDFEALKKDFLIAVECADIAKIYSLSSKNFDLINFRNDISGITPLIAAVKAQKIVSVETLILLGSEFDIVDNRGYTPLMLATERENLDIVKLLTISGANANLKNDMGTTALILAIKNKKIEVVDHLVNTGSDLEIKDNEGNSAAFHAAICIPTYEKLGLTKLSAQKKSTEEKKRKNALGEALTTLTMSILSKGSSSEAKEKDLQISNKYAAYNGADFIKAFADAENGEVDDDTYILNPDYNETLSTVVVKGGPTETEKRLNDLLTIPGLPDLEGNSDNENILIKGEESENLDNRVFVRGSGEENESNDTVVVIGTANDTVTDSPLERQKISSLSVREIDDQKKEEERITQLKKNAHKRNKDGQTLLMVFALKGDIKNFITLVNLGTDINTKDYKGYTCLMLAAHKGHLNIVEELLSRGVDMEVKNIAGYNTLAIAVMNDQVHIATYLLNRGAKKDIIFKRLNLLMIAASKGAINCVKILVELGFNPLLKNAANKSAWDYALINKHTNVVEFFKNHHVRKQKENK
ncbi:MAG: ankyrin repeat domain-containing protein [Oligoflexia bacterium]|nr:ankyrin repeat domain-containing protein [Oligoflexia bacterium]